MSFNILAFEKNVAATGIIFREYFRDFTETFTTCRCKQSAKQFTSLFSLYSLTIGSSSNVQNCICADWHGTGNNIKFYTASGGNAVNKV